MSDTPPPCKNARSCPWCLTKGYHASLELTLTGRGDVLRCWNCGGEYAFVLLQPPVYPSREPRTDR